MVLYGIKLPYIHNFAHRHILVALQINNMCEYYAIWNVHFSNILNVPDRLSCCVSTGYIDRTLQSYFKICHGVLNGKTLVIFGS